MHVLGMCTWCRGVYCCDVQLYSGLVPQYVPVPQNVSFMFLCSVGIRRFAYMYCRHNHYLTSLAIATLVASCIPQSIKQFCAVIVPLQSRLQPSVILSAALIPLLVLWTFTEEHMASDKLLLTNKGTGMAGKCTGTNSRSLYFSSCQDSTYMCLLQSSIYPPHPTPNRPGLPGFKAVILILGRPGDNQG